MRRGLLVQLVVILMVATVGCRAVTGENTLPTETVDAYEEIPSEVPPSPLPTPPTTTAEEIAEVDGRSFEIRFVGSDSADSEPTVITTSSIPVDVAAQYISIMEAIFDEDNGYLKGQKAGSYDGFKDELNDVLFGCGFSPLYAGNPYDWLFLYCSACNTDDYTPLDRFRGVLAQD